MCVGTLLGTLEGKDDGYGLTTEIVQEMDKRATNSIQFNRIMLLSNPMVYTFPTNIDRSTNKQKTPTRRSTLSSNDEKFLLR